MGKGLAAVVCSALCPADAFLWDVKISSTQETHLAHSLPGIWGGPRSRTDMEIQHLAFAQMNFYLALVQYFFTVTFFN